VQAVVRLEPPAADEPEVHYRCEDCGTRWPVDVQRTCPNCAD
jgi:rubrerythrin